MNSKVLLYIERFWLVVAVVSTLILIIYMFQNGLDQLNQFSTIVVLGAWAMFLIRRGMRKRMTRSELEKEQSKNKNTKKSVK